MSEAALYELEDGHLVATELTRGPWDPGAQHGGAPAALIMRALEATAPDDGLAFARVTYELLRPVPLGALDVDAVVVRPGRRVRLLEAALRDGAGVEVMRARALQVRRAEADDNDTGLGALPAGPDGGRASDL